MSSESILLIFHIVFGDKTSSFMGGLSVGKSGSLESEISTCSCPEENLSSAVSLGGNCLFH